MKESNNEGEREEATLRSWDWVAVTWQWFKPGTSRTRIRRTVWIQEIHNYRQNSLGNTISYRKSYRTIICKFILQFSTIVIDNTCIIMGNIRVVAMRAGRPGAAKRNREWRKLWNEESQSRTRLSVHVCSWWSSAEKLPKGSAHRIPCAVL